jgi:hypothetical protein
MNERIRNLLIQAQDLARTEVENDPSIKPPYLIPATSVHKGLGLSYEKFYGLIVQECAEIALTEAQSNGNFDTFNKIVKHFGVEV